MRTIIIEKKRINTQGYLKGTCTPTNIKEKTVNVKEVGNRIIQRVEKMSNIKTYNLIHVQQYIKCL